jgi:hypothetical protein
MQLLTDVHGRSIRLTDERSTHLHTAHLEMSDQLPRIVATLVYPDQIVRSSTDSTVELFYKHYPSTDIEQVLREKKPFILRCMLDGIKKRQGGLSNGPDSR